MAQPKVNKELAGLGVTCTNVDKNEDYATQSKLRTNSPLHGARENNWVTSQTIIKNQISEASASAADRTSLLAPTNNNENFTNFSGSTIKVHAHCLRNEQCACTHAS